MLIPHVKPHLCPRVGEHIDRCIMTASYLHLDHHVACYKHVHDHMVMLAASCSLACSVTWWLLDLPGFFTHSHNGFQCVDAEDDVYADVLSSVYNAVMISKMLIESSMTHCIRVTGGPSNKPVYATKPDLLFCTHSANLCHLQNVLFVQNNVW